MALLEIDMGNTRSKWRLREGQQVLARGVLASEVFPAGLEVAGRIPDRILLASVCEEKQTQVAIDALFRHWGREVERARVLAVCAGVHCAYREPARLGVDRWLAVLAAHHGRCAGESGSVVVSCGTALTIDFVRGDGQHEGGYILPGLLMSQQALLRGTGKVRFEPAIPSQWTPGDSTAAAVQNGSLYQALSVIERARADARQRWHGQAALWLTGGDAPLLQQALQQPLTWVEDLVMDGLHYAL